jgi:isopenicillin-N epimerase
VVFLNHGSFGACPLPVLDEYQRRQRELERRPVEFLARRLEGLLAEARGELAALVGADPDDLVFVPNATAGANVAAASLELRPGDEVVATDLEYGACDLLWEHVCSRAGARYVRARVRLPVASHDEVVDALWAGVSERTRAIFLSHVTSATALVLPVAEVCRRAREAGIATIVDGAHGPGHLDLDLRALGADVYTGNCHKWLCAPKGSAFLWVRRELQESFGALATGWGFGEGATFLSRNERQGTRDPAAYLAVPAAIAWQRERDWPEVRARCHGLARAARAHLAELTRLEPLAPDSREFFGQMVSAPLPPCDGVELQRRLLEEHRIEIPLFERNGHWLLRASFQGYNDERDLDRLVDALVRAL